MNIAGMVGDYIIVGVITGIVETPESLIFHYRVKVSTTRFVEVNSRGTMTMTKNDKMPADFVSALIVDAEFSVVLKHKDDGTIDTSLQVGDLVHTENSRF